MISTSSLFSPQFNPPTAKSTTPQPGNPVKPVNH